MSIEHYDKDAIKSLLLGRKVVKAEMTQIPDKRWGGHEDGGLLTLDDGTVLAIIPNIGGCSCGAGDYFLTELNEVDNIITDVEFLDDPGYEDFEENEKREPQGYKIFVLAEDRRLTLAAMEGTDGNGYYGTGYRIKVVVAEDE